MIRGRLGRAARLARLAPAVLGGDAHGVLVYEVLGSLKGGAQKLGQTLALVSDGFPAPVRARLGALFGDARPLPWEEVEAVLRADLGEPSRLFATIERVPLAAASLGQVYRARRHDGREVAIKVQYPDVAAALASDLANFDLASLPAAFAVHDFAATFSTLKGGLLAELDYRTEAANTAIIAEALRPWPDIVVPAVHLDASTERILTSDLLVGPTLHAVADTLPLARRERVARQLVAAVLGPVFRGGHVNADAHPGNALVLDGDRLGLVDFGAVTSVLPERVARLDHALGALHASTADLSTLAELGFDFGRIRRVGEGVLELFEGPLGPGVWDFAKDDMLEQLGRLKRENALQLRHARFATDVLPVVRAITGLHHSLRRLRVRLPLGDVVADVRRHGA